MYRKIIFFIAAIYIYFLSIFSGLFLFVPVVFLKIYNENLGNFFKNIFYINSSFIIKNFLNTEVFVNSNKLVKQLVNEQKQILLTQNHFTEIDYFFMSWFLTNLDSLRNIFYYNFINVAKKFVGNVFIGIGFLSLISKDIYLCRDIKKDYKVLSKNNDCNLIYIFPEGTCFNKFTRKKSDMFVKENNLVKYKYHLYPRITGLYTIVKNHKKFRTIYDLTVVYDSIDKKNIGEVYRFFDFFTKYDFPNRVYINIQNYQLDNSADLQSIVEYIYMKKDTFIHKFKPDQNQFEKMSYNKNVALVCFIFINILSYFSFKLFIQYDFVRSLYCIQILAYLIYFNLFY